MWNKSSPASPPKAVTDKQKHGRSDAEPHLWACWKLRRNPSSMKERAWLELFLRYVEVALESSERRSAVVELSTIVEATKRLNSTLDLAELLNIILGLTTRHSGAEPGAVTVN
jgi:hypothetical protein